MLRLIFSFIFVIFLSSCITAKEVRLPDGSVGQHVTCGGQIYSFGDCVAKAGEICGANGYMVLGSNGEQMPYSNSSATWANGVGGFNAQSGTIVQRDLFVKCNP